MSFLVLCLAVFIGIVSFDKMLEENDKGPFGNSALSQWQLIFGVCVVVGIISLAIVAK